MMFGKTKLVGLFMVVGMDLAANCAAPSAQAQTTTPPPVQVGKCRGGVPSYSTIQAAVNAAAAGASVYVCPGIFPEQVTISKNLSLAGVPSGNANAAVIVPPSGGLVQNATDPSPASANPPIAAQLSVQGPNITVNLTNLTVDGSNNQLSSCSAPTLVGVYYLHASGTLQGLNLRNQLLGSTDRACNSGLGSYLEGTSANAITFKNSTVSNYQKNGITANGDGSGTGPVINFTGNTVVGQGPAAGIAQNGIQIGYGASGKITVNLLLDSVSSGTSSSSVAATGILLNASNGVTVFNDKISNTDFAVAAISDAVYGTADGNNINTNIITASKIAAVELCGNKNIVQWNDLYSSGQAAVKVDSSCTEGPGGGSSGNGNTVNNNNFNGDCAGILVGSGTGNTFATNPLVVNVFTTIASGSTCTPPNSTSAPATGFPVPFR
jgi:hypothetical protein